MPPPHFLENSLSRSVTIFWTSLIRGSGDDIRCACAVSADLGASEGECKPYESDVEGSTGWAEAEAVGAVLLTPPETRCMLRSSSASCSQLVRMLLDEPAGKPGGSLALAALADFFASSTAHCTSGGRSGAGAVQTAGSAWREHERFKREHVSSQGPSVHFVCSVR